MAAAPAADVPAGRPVSSVRRLHRDESGTVVNAPAALLMFLGFLLLAVQISLHLFAVSTSTSVMFDVARKVAAGADSGSYTCDMAREEVARRLGGWSADLDIGCRGDAPPADAITVTVTGPSPAQVLAGFSSLTGLDTFDRQVQVRTERFR